ncbi:MAG TPA: RNA methyltransferase [Limnobacter sp.]|nr:RNA methyltransferase [Limnobacter sp.]
MEQAMGIEGKFRRIESAQNERFKAVIRLMGSNSTMRATGLAAAEGLHLAEYLLEGTDQEIESIWAPDSLSNNQEWLALLHSSGLLQQGDFPLWVLPDNLYSRISRLGTPTGPLIFFKPPTPVEALNLQQDVVLLDGIQDPGNVGTILRNCAAAGIGQVAFSEHCAWVWSEKVLRAGMGAQFGLRLYSEKNLLQAMSELRVRMPVRVTSLHPSSVDLFDLDLTPAGVWVFGSEGQGVSKCWLERATTHIRIPQTSLVESMNVGSSSAVCLFEQLRQRR